QTDGQRGVRGREGRGEGEQSGPLRAHGTPAVSGSAKRGNAKMTGSPPQEWFEMADLRRRRFATAVWVPLRASETVDPQGEYARPKSREELLCVGSIAFPPASRMQAEKLGWSDLGLMHSGGPYAFKDKPYKPAEVYQHRDGEDL